MGMPAFDMGAFVKGLPTTVRIAGSTVASTNTGPSIDRRTDLTGHYMSLKGTVLASYTKTSGVAAFTWSQLIQHSSLSTSGYTTLSSNAGVSIAASSIAVANTLNINEMDVNLVTAKRYLRHEITVGLISSVATNAINLMGMMSFGGSNAMPAA